MQKIIVILGPTATGKSDLAVKLAKKFNGEVISADSRQVYRGLNIGTGKITKKEMKGVRHHLLDVADPKNQFTVIEYKALAEKAIQDIRSRGKLPVICGGSAFYIDAVLNQTEFPPTGADKKLRAKLAHKSAANLFIMLKKLDPRRASSMNYSDSRNPRRLIRAIEIATAIRDTKKEGLYTNRPADKSTNLKYTTKPLPLKYDALYVGLKASPVELRSRIHVRLLKRLKGMITEAGRLHAKGLSWKRMEELGLEYRYLARFLQGKISRDEMITKLETEIWRFSRRQMTWWKRDTKIKWFEPTEISKIIVFVRNRI